MAIDLYVNTKTYTETDWGNYVDLCSNLWTVNISALLRTIKSSTRFVINRMRTDGMQIEGVKLEVVICSVRSSVSEAHTKVHNDKEERRVPISKRLRDTSHNKENAPRWIGL